MIENSIEINKLNEFTTKNYTKNNNDIDIMKLITKFNIMK